LLAQQIVHGEAQYDTWVIDPRRFTGHATVELTALKAIEDYQNEFRFHFPHEHRPAGRPMKTTPLTAVFEAEGAEMGIVNGWERIDYIKPSPDFTETLGFRFNELHDVIGEEVNAVATGVAMTEVSGFNRFEMTGADVHSFLDRMMCGTVTKRWGRVGLGYLLNEHGMVKGESTIANIPASDRGENRVWYGSAAASEFHDMDWLQTHLREDEDVTIKSLTNSQTILILAGPKSRDVLSAAARGDWTREAFPWLSVRETHIGIAPATVLGISFSGELAYEIHVPNESLHAAYAALRKAGAEHGLRLFGARAVESMRIEKGFLHWKADILTEFDPFETSLERFIKMDKGDFVGKAALEKRVSAGPQRKLVTLVVDTKDAPAHGGASVRIDGRIVGTVTSGDWGYRTGMNLAYAFVEPDFAAPDTEVTIDVIGSPVPARVIPAGPYDPTYARMRA
jgi:dimethylglycine dehydrogenase